jgi:hypothetical protein
MPPTAISKTAQTYVGTASQTAFVNAGAVFASAGKKLAIFALVQQYNPEAGGGATATGESSGNIYVQIWEAFNPANVTVIAFSL